MQLRRYIASVAPSSVARWQRLLNDSDARKQRLLRLQEQYRQVEDLYLTFAKKASAFNSWFENAEEDLTDPVRCNSVEEIKALREAHDQFKASLSAAETDFNQLAELDKKIKSFNVGPNPYTWFTMEALDDTWRNLQKIIKVRFRCPRSEFWEFARICAVRTEEVCFKTARWLLTCDLDF